MAKVLVVDQELSYCQSIAQQLADEGHQIEFATTANDATQLARQFAPDLLIADSLVFGSPEAQELLADIFRAAPRPRTILMTGFPEDTLEQTLGKTRFDALLTKPFTLVELSQAVAVALALGNDSPDPP